MIEWVMTGLVTSMAVQKAKGRMASIAKKRDELEQRWGEEVSGTIPLDEEGFPFDPAGPR